MRISSRFVKGRYLRGKDREEEKEEKIDFVLNHVYGTEREGIKISNVR